MQAVLEKRPPAELDSKLEQFTRASDSQKVPPDPWPIIWEFRQRIEHDRARFAELLGEARNLMELLDFEQQLSTANEALKARAEYAANHVNRLFAGYQPRPDAARASEERSTLLRVLSEWTRAVDEFRTELARIQSAKAALEAYKEAIREVFGQGIADTVDARMDQDVPVLELSSPDTSAEALIEGEMKVHEFVAGRHPSALGRVAITYRGPA